MQAERNAVAETLRKPAAELDRADARCIACIDIPWYAGTRRSTAAVVAAAGFGSFVEYVGVWMAKHPIMSRKKMPGDAAVFRIATLLLELVQSDELPPLVHFGAWYVLVLCLLNRPAVASRLLELRVFDIVLAELRKLGRSAVSVLDYFKMVLVS
jgi:hypothetical protein